MKIAIAKLVVMIGGILALQRTGQHCAIAGRNTTFNSHTASPSALNPCAFRFNVYIPRYILRKSAH